MKPNLQYIDTMRRRSVRKVEIQEVPVPTKSTLSFRMLSSGIRECTLQVLSNSFLWSKIEPYGSYERDWEWISRF